MGRNLNTAQVGSTTYTYRYNADGIRTQKRIGNTVATQYYLSGNTLVAEKTGSDLLVYLLDENGAYYGFTYNGTRYTYVTDMQGDVVAIVDANGVAVAGYDYDAWGNCTVTNVGGGAIGDINPIRYRGYYYDTELGLYYLQSRYYDPNTGRFISPDAVEYLGANGTVDSYNLYAYCENDPVNGVDPSGNFYISYSKIVYMLQTIGLLNRCGLGVAIKTLVTPLSFKIPLLMSWVAALPLVGQIAFCLIVAATITIATEVLVAYFQKKGLEISIKYKWFIPYIAFSVK